MGKLNTLVLLAGLCLGSVMIGANMKETKSPESETKGEWTLVIHGGAGTILKENMTPELEKAYRSALTKVLEAGQTVLSEGRSAMDAVETCIRIMEDDTLFNAGRGAVYTADGKNELDASIMDGATRKAGAVAGVSTVRHPISAARKVMEQSPHVMMAREGAEAFAKEQGLEIVSPDFFRTERRYRQWERLQEKKEIQLDHDSPEEQNKKHGTVGVVARDMQGNIAAGTSTGGMTNKQYGRIGDSPIIGAGTWADNATCGISSTGHGEFFIRYAVAHDIHARMAYKGLSLQEAATEVVMQVLVEAGGEGGIIGVDAEGNPCMMFNTKGMYRGLVRSGTAPKVAIYDDESIK